MKRIKDIDQDISFDGPATRIKLRAAYTRLAPIQVAYDGGRSKNCNGK